MYRTYTFPIYPQNNAKKFIDDSFEELHCLIIEQVKNELKIEGLKNLKPRNVPTSSTRHIINLSLMILRHKRYGFDQFQNLFIKQKKHAFFQSVNFAISTEIILKSRDGTLFKVSYRMTEYVKEKLSVGNLVSVKIYKKNRKYLASVLVKIRPSNSNGIYKAGLDVGIKVPAVLCTQNNSVRFYKGGKIRRYLISKQVSLLKNNEIHLSKKLKVSRKLKNLDHKISSMIVKDLIKLNVKQLNIEDLKHIQLNKTKQLQSSWSYERLQRYIIYKCDSSGIQVNKVDPRFTSRLCPKCKRHNQAYKRIYSCFCGYRQHRDVVGATNIMNR
jgi:IS605 OrfB family transposase